MTSYAPTSLKLTRVTEAKCLRHLVLEATGIVIFAGYAANEIWRHKYGFAAGMLAAVLHLTERFYYWLNYKRALRSADRAALPELRGIQIISFDQEPIAPGSTRTRTVAIEASVRPSRTFAILLSLIDAFVVACCALCIYIWRLHFLWASLSAFVVALVSILLIAYLWSNVLPRRYRPLSRWN